MWVIRPENLTLKQQQAVADRVGGGRLIALHPIYILGPFAFFWSYGFKVRAIRGRAVITPRIRLLSMED